MALLQDPSSGTAASVKTSTPGGSDASLTVSISPNSASIPVTFTNSTVEITDGTNGVAAIKPASTTPVVGDKALTVTVSPNTATVPISAASLPLPSGAATNSALTTISGQLPTTLGAHVTSASVAVNIASDQTVPVSAAALPLPSGAATSALQGTANSSLSTIATNTTGLATASAQTTGNSSLSTIATNTTGLATSSQFPSTIGAHLTSASLAVNIASDQTVSISAASLPLPTGASTSALQTTGNTSLATIATNTTGAATSANLTTLGSQTTKINDGTNTAAVKAASTAPATTDPALVVSVSPNTVLGLPTGASTSALQTTGNTSLATIATNTTGSSTSALQSAGNTTLATIATNTTGIATSALQTTGNTSLSTIATNTSGIATSANQTTGNTSLATIATNTAGLATASAQTTGNTSLASIVTNTTGVATAANQTTVGNQTTKINDGTNTAAVKAASTAATATDPALVVAVSPNNTLTVGLPSGASTSALQTTGNTSLATIATNTTGASTSALQTTGNTSLASIVTNTTGLATATNQTTGLTTLSTIATNTTGAATATNQTTGNTSLATIATNTTGVSTSALQGTGNASLATIATNTTGVATATNQTTLGNQTTKINDGTNTAAVKAASTTPATTDPALTVSLSPNSAVQPYQTGSGTISALNGTVVMPASGGVQLNITGTWVGTLTLQITNGDGVWQTITGQSSAVGSAFTSTTTVNTFWQINAGGYVQLRVVASAWTSGTANVSWSSAATARLMNTYSLIASNFNTTSLISDGTNTAAVKAASTAAVATDPALVVAISPNNTVPISNASLTTIATNTAVNPPDMTTTGTITALNGAVTLVLTACDTTTVNITGTWTATLWAEVQLAGSSSWIQVPVYAVAASTLPPAVQTTITANGTFIIETGGYSGVRLRANAYTSGTASLIMQGSTASNGITQLGQWNVGGSAVSQTNTLSTTGTLVALPSTTIPSLTPYSGLVFAFSGTWAGSVSVLGGNDGVNYTAVQAVPLGNQGGSPVSVITQNGIYYVPIGPLFLNLSFTATSGTISCVTKAQSISPVLPASSGELLAPSQVQLGGSGGVDTFGMLVTGNRSAQIQIPFYQNSPANLMTVTLTGTGSTAQGTGVGTFSTGATAGGRAQAVSIGTVQYTSGNELWAAVSAAFTTSVVGTYQRIGLYNATDGFSFGYSGITFGLWTRYNTTDTFIAQTLWNIDTLSGLASSKFTSSGVGVALVPTNLNIYRIRFGWLGVSNAIFEVMSPDGNWVAVHNARFANSQTTVSVTNPNMPITVDVFNNASATNLTITSGCLVAGTSGAPGTYTAANGLQAQQVVNLENQRPTYSIGVQNFAIASGATDVFILNGSATKTIRITHIEFSMTTTTAVVIPVSLVKRSTANTGGTTGSAVVGVHDSNDAASTATNLFYATNAATLGTIVGTLYRARKYFSEVATPTSEAQTCDWSFGQNGDKPIVLRGTAQGLAINLNGTAFAGGTMTVTCTWTEDNN